MVNRRVKVDGKVGTVIRWEPLSMQMCDALVRFDDGIAGSPRAAFDALLAKLGA